MPQTRKIGSTLVLIFMSLVLSGCYFERDTPLFDKTLGEILVKDDVYFAFLDPSSGHLKLNSIRDEPKLERAGGIFYNYNYYEFTSDTNEGEETSNVSFHDSGIEGHYIIQIAVKEKYQYSLSKKNGNLIFWYDFEPKKGEYKKIVERGYRSNTPSTQQDSDKAIKVNSASDLKKIARYILDIRGIDDIEFAKDVVPIELFSRKSDLEDKLTQAVVYECLVEAGHPYSPLPKGVGGVAIMTKIENKKAAPLCEEALSYEKTNKSVRYALARIAYNSEQYATVMEHVDALIDEDFSLAHLLKGQMYQLGEGLQKDPQKAVYHYKKAAEADFAPAHFSLGVGYGNGSFGAVDKELSFSHYKKAAEHKYPDALSSVAYAYYNGSGIAKDLKRSAQYAKEAAELGVVSAEYLYGFMLLHGQGVQKDEALSLKYIERAARDKHTSAQSILGDIYRQGLGLKKNNKLALEWYKKAAEKDDGYSQYIIGWMYYKGQGVKRDYGASIDWLKRAIENKSEPAKKLLLIVVDLNVKESEAKLKAIREELLGPKGPSSNDIKVALQSKLNIGLKTYDAMGDLCKDVKRSQNPFAAMMCIATLGGNINSKTIGMNVSSVDLDKCHSRKQGGFICRYNARISGNETSRKNPWIGLITALKDLSGYQYASFVRSNNTWLVEQIYESCRISETSSHCTYKK